MRSRTNKREARASQALPLSKKQLEALVEEATADAYGESEQATGFLTMIEDNLRMSFSAQVRGVKVTVARIAITEADEVVAICERGGKWQSISILELPLPAAPPGGAEWIEAYRYWRKGFR